MRKNPLSVEVMENNVVIGTLTTTQFKDEAKRHCPSNLFLDDYVKRYNDYQLKIDSGMSVRIKLNKK